jgi:hypothetical protein
MQLLADDQELRKEMSDAALQKIKFLNGWNEYSKK